MVAARLAPRRRACIAPRSPAADRRRTRRDRERLAPDDLYQLRIATDPRLSPDGRHALVTRPDRPPRSATATATRSGSCRSTATATATPRQLTLGAKHDGHARWSPDGRTLAFLSDRRHLVEEEPDAGDKKDREDGSQVHLLCRSTAARRAG